MIMNFHDLARKYKLKINGVIIVGAFYGLVEEQTFSSLGVKNMVFFEPLDWGFNVLRNNFAGKYFIYQYALGNMNGKVTIHGEADNGGMSSSVLKPKKHLQYYPNITFPDKYQFEVEMKKLDDFGFGSTYNMLDIDVQGYELEVLRGGINTLPNIDYVYCEVNREELYEGCPMVEEIDQFLHEFTRVDTAWTPCGYGDALYVRY